MKNKKYQKIKNTISSIVIISAIVFFIGFFVVTNWKINKRRTELTARITELQEEIKIAEEKNSELKEKKEKTESDEYVEEVAREQLELKKPGEEVIVIQEPADSEGSGVAKDEEKSWWDKIKSIWQK